MLHTGLSSTGFNTLDFSSRTYSLLGATAHQPAGWPSAYAMIPGDVFVAIFRKAFLLPSPFRRLYSDALDRQYIHQQPPQAPLSPNNATKSFQLPGVNDEKVNFINLSYRHTMQPDPIPFGIYNNSHITIFR